MKKHSNKSKIAIIALTLVLCMAVVGISAYFTDADTATNTFTIGEISLDLQEPNWDPDDVRDVVPNETIEKDPQIKNDGVNDEFVFLTVSIPYANVVTADADGTKNAAADTELFSYTVNSGWIQIGSEVKDANTMTVTRTYAYGSETAMTALSADATTPTLFDTVTFANIVEDQNLENTSKEIVINAYGIQSENINGGKTAPADVWTVVQNQAPATDVGVAEDPKTDIKQ